MKKTQLEAQQGMKYLLGIVLLGLFFINFASAYTWDNVKEYSPTEKTITIKDSLLGIPTTKVAEYKLELAPKCFIDCYMQGTATLYEDGTLFDAMKFIDKLNDEKENNYKIKIWKEFETEKEIWNSVCEKVENKANGTMDDLCRMEQSTKMVADADFQDYKGETLKAGTYKWKIELNKKPSQTIDAIPSAFGVEMDEWAWFNVTHKLKKKVTIGNADLEANNFTLELYVEVNESIAADFSDIRFTNVTEDEELPYWIEYYNATGAMVWVNVHNLQGETNTEIYMYYNATTTTTSNISTAFFRGTDCNEAAVPNGFAEIDTGGGTITYGSGVCTLTSAVAAGGWVAIKTDVNFLPNWTMMYNVIEAVAGGNVQEQGFSLLDGGNEAYLSTKLAVIRNSDYAFQIHNLNAASTYVTGINGSGTVYQKYRIDWNDANTTVYDNSSTKVIAATNTPVVNLYGALTADADAISNLYLNWTGITRKVSPDPTITFGDEEAPDGPPTITLNSPANDSNYTTAEVTYNCSAEDDIQIATLKTYINDNLNKSTTPGAANAEHYVTQNYDDGIYNWNCTATDSGSNYVKTATWTFTVDTTIPDFNITAPINNTEDIEDFMESNVFTSYINYTVTDATIGLQNCWYYNFTVNTNVTLTNCGDNVTLNLINGSYQYYVYANDTFGNEASSMVNHSYMYRILRNDNITNYTTFEGLKENFYTNITYNPDLYSGIEANLVFDGINYTASKTEEGNGVVTFSYDLSIPLNSVQDVQDKSFFWEFYMDDGYNINSTNETMTVNYTWLDICNETYAVPYVNLSFQDETNASGIKGSINSMTWTYWIGTDSAVNRTLSLINNTDNWEHQFCLQPEFQPASTTLTTQYSNTESGYPLRTYTNTSFLISNDSYNLMLYLISSGDGIYTTIQVTTIASIPIADVYVTAETGGSVVGSGYTGDDGGITFWVNPNNAYTFTASKAGYDAADLVVTPTQSIYTITLGTPANSTYVNYYTGINYAVYPVDSILNNDTAYYFNFTINSTYWELEEFGFNIYNGSGTFIGSNSSTTSTGGWLDINLPTTGNVSFYMNWYWKIDGNYTNASRTWIIEDIESGTPFSLTRFFSDLAIYTDDDGELFGLNEFTKALIAFVIIFVTVGILSYVSGIYSPLAIVSLITVGTIAFDIMGFFPAGTGVAGIHFPSIFMGIITIYFIWREFS